MIQAIAKWLPGKGATQQNTAIPADLIAALESATITWRTPDEDGNPRAVIRAAGLGSWTWEGLDHAAERIQRHEGLPMPTCRKAARILAGVMAKRNRDSYRPERRRSWVWDWER